MPFNLSALHQQHQKLIREVAIGINKSLETAGQEIQADVRQTSTFQGDTLKNSIRYSVKPYGKSSFQLKVWSPLKHALYIEEGTKPHPIFAKNFEFLRFWSRIENKIVFRRKVFHPGNRPYLFLKDATDRAALTLPLHLQRNLP